MPTPLQEIKNWYDDPSRIRYDKQGEGYIALLIYLAEKSGERVMFYLEQWESSVKSTDEIFDMISQSDNKS